MKFIYLSILVFISTVAVGQVKLINKDSPVAEKYKVITIDNAMATLQHGQKVQEGSPIGSIAPKPIKRSENFEQQLAQSQALYLAREYSKAAEVIKQAVLKEPKNPFLLEAYARALYQIDTRKKESYQVYKRLVAQLDAKATAPNELLVDSWFQEAYWKLGTLHMDNGNWQEGLLEIGKFMLMAGNLKDQPVFEQALSFLTECAFEMNDKTLCKHFGKRTLEVNPKNQYVLEYLAALKK